MADRIEAAKVVRLAVEEPLRPIEVEPRYDHVLLIVSSGGEIAGEVTVPAQGTLSTEEQRAAIDGELGDRLARAAVTAAFARATGAREPAEHAEAPGVSVVICTRDRPDELRTCLESLRALTTSPEEIVVVDNCPSDARAERVCADLGVRHVLEPVPGLSRARNRGILETGGEVVAFTDDDCVVDPGWLDRVGRAFADPLVMVLAGYVGPLELETPAQCLFQFHGGFRREFERTVFDGFLDTHAGVGDGNSFFRRRAFEEVGLFAEDLGPGTPALSAQDADIFHRLFMRGYRVLFDPACIVWHRHRRDPAAARATLASYAAGISAYATRAVLERGDLTALKAPGWWWRYDVPRDLLRIARGDERRVTLGVALSEAAATLTGPWRLRRSARAKRAEPPLAFDGRPPRPRSSDDADVRVAEAENPPLSVTIASYNRRDNLREVLEALAHQDYPAERFETVVVLDGSTDGSAEMVGALEVPYSLRLVTQENRGLARSRNRGGEEASAPVVVFLDDDIVPEPGFLAEHAAAHRRAREEHIALGSYPPARRGEDLLSIAIRRWWHDHFRRKAEPNHHWSFVDFADGNASFPKRLLAETGGWDDDFTGGRRQDWEFALRLLRDGVPIGYYPNARGWHHFDTTLENAIRNRRVEGRNDIVLATKQPQVKSHLYLARIYRTLDRGGLGARVVRMTYERPEETLRFAERALPAARILERMKLRRQWWALVGRLLSQAYVVGVRDSLPTVAELREFAAPILNGSDVETVPFPLDGDGRIELPRGGGAVDFTVQLDGAELARIRATEPEAQWDWDEVTQRLAEGAAGPLRRALADSGGPEGGRGAEELRRLGLLR